MVAGLAPYQYAVVVVVVFMQQTTSECRSVFVKETSKVKELGNIRRVKVKDRFEGTINFLNPERQVEAPLNFPEEILLASYFLFLLSLMIPPRLSLCPLIELLPLHTTPLRPGDAHPSRLDNNRERMGVRRIRSCGGRKWS